MTEFMNNQHARIVSRRARHAYILAKIAGDLQGMRKADETNRAALNHIRTNR